MDSLGVTFQLRQEQLADETTVYYRGERPAEDYGPEAEHRPIYRFDKVVEEGLFATHSPGTVTGRSKRQQYRSRLTKRALPERWRVPKTLGQIDEIRSRLAVPWLRVLPEGPAYGSSITRRRRFAPSLRLAAFVEAEAAPMDPVALKRFVGARAMGPNASRAASPKRAQDYLQSAVHRTLAVQAHRAAAFGLKRLPISNSADRFTRQASNIILRAIPVDPYKVGAFLDLLHAELVAFAGRSRLMAGWGNLRVGPAGLFLVVTATVSRRAAPQPRATVVGGVVVE